MLLSLTCRECGHKPPPDARFCDQCGVQVSFGSDKEHGSNPVPKPLNMSTALLHSDFNAVFDRMREAKRTSKSLANFFRSYATQEHKQTMEMQKALAALSCHESESRTLLQFFSQLNANLDKQGRLSVMFSNCLLDEVSNNLNQLRLQLKQHHKASFDSYSKALKALAASDTAIQKCRDRIARLEKQSTTPSSSSNLISAARAAVGPAPTLTVLKADLEKALLEREASSQALASTRAAILRDWEVMEQSRMATMLDSVERGLSLSGSLLRQKVAFNCDLLSKLKSVSTHEDILCWVQKHVASPSTQPADLPSDKPPEVLDASPELPMRKPDELKKSIFVWVPATDSKQWPMLTPTLSEAKLLALCFCYRSADAEQQRYCRRDLRVLLGVRESVLDSALVAINRIEGNLGPVLQDPALSFDQRRLVCLIAVGQFTDESSFQDLQTVLEAGDNPDTLRELQLLSLGTLDIQAPFAVSYSLMLYRALFSAIVEDGAVAYLSEPIDSESVMPTISEDWSTIMKHLVIFRAGRGISDSAHAAVWLHCIRYDILPQLPEPRPDRKLDITETTSETTITVIEAAVNASVAITDPDPILTTVIGDFKDWVNVMLTKYFCLSPSSKLWLRNLFLLFGSDNELLKQSILEAARNFYHDARSRTTELTKEFVQIVLTEMQLHDSIEGDAVLHADFKLLHDEIRSQIWSDVLKQITARPGAWIQILELVHDDQLWDQDKAERIAHDQTGIWLEEIEVGMADKIEKMLLVDPRTPIDSGTPFSSSVVDLFSALNAIIDIFERIHSGLGRMKIAVGDNVVPTLMTLVTSSIRFYSKAIVSSSRPTDSETKAKTELRRHQTDCNVLISQAAAKSNAKAKILNLTKTVKKLANRTTDDGHVSDIAPNMIPLPVAASTRTIPELVIGLNNCRQATIQLGHIVERLRSFSGNVTPNAAAYQHLETSCSELAQLLADRFVFHDLRQLLATVYYPSPSSENSMSTVALKVLDDSMASLFSQLHDDLFPSAPMFPRIVSNVFSSVLTAFLWIVSAGAGDRVYQDVDYSLLTEDLNAIQTLFESELPDDVTKYLGPVTAHLELMALSSNELIEEIQSARISKSSAALVLTRRTDPIALSWIKSQAKYI